MRLQPIGFCLAVLAAACGTDKATTGDDDGIPGGGSQDPGGGSQDPGGGTMLPPPARGFQIVSPPVTIAAGQEITYCYYFKTSNTAALPIQSWKSHMSPGSHHMILYFTKTEEQPAGTVTATNCGGGGGGLNAPVWTYASQVEDQEFTLPGNDGTGLPLAQNVLAGQPAYIQMHYLNATDHAISAHVELNASAYPEGVAVRGAAPYITYNTNINLGATQGSTTTAMGTCTISPTVKFFTISTHVHKQGVHTYVKDGSSMVFESTDWEHPGDRTWDASPFFSFSSGQLYYQCDYLNASGTKDPIVDGPSAATNEMCMAVGYYFDPASTAAKARYCLDSFTVPN
jgi:hypothetical protein